MKTLSFRPFLLATLAFLTLGGCASSPPPGQSAQPATPPPAMATEPAKPPADGSGQEQPQDLVGQCPDAQTIRASEQNRASCFHLQPGATVTVTKKVRTSGKLTKAIGQKDKKGKIGKKPQARTTTRTIVQRTIGRCQPQSLIYARCRTGILTCKQGDTSPVQWFACAKKNGATTPIPTAGSVLVLAVNSGRGMPTGHPMYVEAVKDNGDGTWTLRISLTNYDRQCHLDQDATVLYHLHHGTANFQSGPWATWAKNLHALGFILQ